MPRRIHDRIRLDPGIRGAELEAEGDPPRATVPLELVVASARATFNGSPSALLPQGPECAVPEDLEDADDDWESVPPSVSRRARYHSLGEKEDFRILRLYPSVVADCLLLARLFVHSASRQAHLVPKGRFEALSYVWGDPARCSSIYCHQGGDHDNTMVVPITESLDIAVRHLRHVDKPRDLWIDAICINQDDDAERSQQVAIMGDIFSQAWRVVVWLGPDVSGKARSAFDTIRSKLAFLSGPNPSGGEEQPADMSLLHVEFHRTQAWSNVNAAVLGVFGRTWFRRLWYVGFVRPPSIPSAC